MRIGRTVYDSVTQESKLGAIQGAQKTDVFSACYKEDIGKRPDLGFGQEYFSLVSAQIFPSTRSLAKAVGPDRVALVSGPGGNRPMAGRLVSAGAKQAEGKGQRSGPRGGGGRLVGKHGKRYSTFFLQPVFDGGPYARPGGCEPGGPHVIDRAYQFGDSELFVIVFHASDRLAENIGRPL